MGDRVFANMLLVGASWQQGGIPLSYDALMRAIELNGVAIEKNKQAFELGRLVIAEPETAAALMGTAAPIQIEDHRAQTLEGISGYRIQRLTEYGGNTLAERYSATLGKLKAAGLPGEAQMVVAKGLYKLLAVKDEWEVARLYARPEFKKSLEAAFDGDLKLRFHVGAWPFAKKDKATGKIHKGEVGAWLLPVFKAMSKLRWLRGSVVDPFRNNAEAKLNRKALADYEDDINFALNFKADQNTQADLNELLDLPEHIRGYGHVREAHLARVEERRKAIRSRLNGQGKGLPKSA